MNTIPASEIKRRGISAVDDLLKEGPVHVVKNNRPMYVVLSEQDYQETRPASARESHSVWDFLQSRPWQGTKSKDEIDAMIAEERASWND